MAHTEIKRRSTILFSSTKESKIYSDMATVVAAEDIEDEEASQQQQLPTAATSLEEGSADVAASPQHQDEECAEENVETTIDDW